MAKDRRSGKDRRNFEFRRQVKSKVRRRLRAERPFDEKDVSRELGLSVDVVRRVRSEVNEQ